MRKTSAQTYIVYFLSKLWAVLGICFFIVVFVNVSQGKVPFPHTLLIADIGTLASGWAMRFKPLAIGGILFLLAAIVSLDDDLKLLVHGAAIVIGYLIPRLFTETIKSLTAEKFKELDPVLNTPVRLAIASVLVKMRQVDFNTLMEITKTTQGNMSHQLKRLNDEGYITIEKSFKGNYLLTTCKLTPRGRKAFENYGAVKLKNIYTYNP